MELSYLFDKLHFQQHTTKAHMQLGLDDDHDRDNAHGTALAKTNTCKAFH